MTNTEMAHLTDADLSAIMDGEDDATAVAAFAEFNRRDAAQRAGYVAGQRAGRAAVRIDVFGREW